MGHAKRFSALRIAVAVAILVASCGTGDNSSTSNPNGTGTASGGNEGGIMGSGVGASGSSSGSRADGGSSGADASSGSSGSRGSSGSSGGSSGGTSSSSGGGGDAGVASPDASRSCGTPPPATMISDFEEGLGILIHQQNRTGPWSTYADSTPRTAMPALNGSGIIPASAAPADDNPGTCNAYALHVSDSGHSMYCGIVAPFNGTTAASSWSTYDLSAYDGIQFDIKTGAGSQGSLFFEVLSKETQPTPAGVASNTAIDLYNNRGYVLSATGSTPSGTSVVIPTSMTTVYVPFALLVPRWFPQPGPSGCGSATCNAPSFLPANALGLQLSAYNDFSTTGSYDVWLDNVSLFTGDAGLTPPGMTMPSFKDGSSGWSCTRPTFLGGKSAAGKYLLWAYHNWKANYVKTAGSANIVISPEVDGGSVVSEGIAYGMLIAAYMGDQSLFDGLWSYWSSHSAVGHLMNWKYTIDGNGLKGNGSATDADQDAAFALYLASKIWPSNSNYASDASATMADIWAHDFDHASNLPTYGSNAGDTSNNPTNPSYFAPAYYPLFGPSFSAAASAVYGALNNMAGLGTLPPAWCSNNCTSAGGGGYANATDYQYDAHRVPWRVGLDYCWSGSSAASGYLSKISQFFAAQAMSGIDSLYDEYTTSGGVCTSCNPAAQPNSMSLIGAAVVGALAGSNGDFVNAGWQFVLDGLNRGTPNVKATGNNYYTYYNTTVGLLTALTMSGNFYKP
jgi:endo-1,4-beta-D-glucanase Y